MSYLNNRPLILITNDDGIDSPGLLAAAFAAADFGDILIAAPDTQQTGMGRAFPRREDTGIIKKRKLCVKGNHCTGYAVHGSPSQAVAYAVMELTARKPDLCISGINYGENPGLVPTCSGTLGAAFEAASHGIPAIAVSSFLDYKKHRSLDFENHDWSAAQAAVSFFIRERLLEGKYAAADVLNINVPAGMKPPYVWKMTSQSRQNYFQFVEHERHEFDTPYLLPSEIGYDVDSLDRDSDIYTACVEHLISVTPLSLDMTVWAEVGKGGKIDESR